MPDKKELTSEDYSYALAFAAKKHADQTRKDGSAYIMHPVLVAHALAFAGYGMEYQITGLFHDLLEDTDATEEEILDLSNEAVLRAVILLTKEEGYDHGDYISRILADPIAKQVKNQDRIYNLQDCDHATADFRRKYIEDTKAWYVGRFSKELDDAYEALVEDCKRRGEL